MKKHTLLLLISGVLHLAAFSQTENYCGTDEVRKRSVELYPEILETEAQFNNFAKIRLGQIARVEGETLVIPVVFHVIHDYGPENISDEQIFNAIENINADFSATNADFINTIPEFQDIAVNCEIEFRLAQKELSGGCTNGITRTASLRTYNGSDAAKLDGWQSGKYLNIWVVKSLPAGTAAYAYYPTSIVGMMYTVDGIICRYDYVGTIGAAGPYAAHVLSHEIGHYLNLQHPWGNTNAPGVACGDDQIPDTPVTEGWTSCNLAGNTCGGGVDNVQNHMDYAYCSTMFTEDQKSRMYAALESEDAMRNNLWTEENLTLTGTNDGYASGLCAPVADFYTPQRYICTGEHVTFYDVSYKSAVDTRLWTFEGAVPSTSTEENPVVTYAAPGWYAVTLLVTNVSGTDAKEWTNYIHVSPDVATYDRNYFADFNDEALTNADWVLYNKYVDDFEWKWKGANGYWNTGCIWLNSNYAPDLESDAIISPVFDLSDGLANNIFFKYSTTSSGLDAGDYTMSLKMYYSINCGDSWISMGKITGSDLITSYGGSVDFYPQYPDQWGSAAFNIPANAKDDHVQFKIEFVANAFANNIFIDDFNFTSGALSTQDQEAFMDIIVYPNPSSPGAATTIQYSLKEPANLHLDITDLAGRRIASSALGLQESGSHAYTLDCEAWQLTSGCYFIRLSDGLHSTRSRLVIL